MEDEERTFQEIYETYRSRIQRYLERLVGEPEAEDLTQEVFVKVSLGLPAFRGDSQVSTWVYRIATNAAIDKIRTAAFQQDARLIWLDENDEDGGLAEWQEDSAPSLEQQLMHKEMYECFVDFVKRLPATYRSIVVLSELEQLPNDVIAEIMSLSVGAVKIRLHRGRSRLLQELKAYCKADDWL